MAHALDQRDEIDRLVQELTTWDKDLAPFRETWRMMWEAWEPPAPAKAGKRKDDPLNPFLSRVRVPWGHYAVETITPRIVGFDPRMHYKALDSRDDLPVAAMMGGLATWQLARMGFELEARDFVRQGCVIGYTVGILGWIRQEVDEEVDVPRFVHAPELFRTFQVTETEFEHKLVRNEPFFETIDVAEGDFVWPLLAPDIDKASAVWHRRWVTRKYLLDRTDVYKNVDEVKGDSFGRLRDSRRERFEWQDAQVSPSPDELDPDEGIVELWSRWTNDRLCVIADPFTSPVKVRDATDLFDHNRKPFLDWAPTPHPFQMHGIGVIQTIYDQNEDLNTLRRQRRDAMTYILNPAWAAIGIPGDQLSLFPGKLVNLEGELDDIKALINPPIDFAASYQEESAIKQDMRDTTGAHSVLAGTPVEGAQTATEIATLTQEGNTRVGEMVKVFEQRPMKRLGELLASMNVQYVDTEVALDFSDDPAAMEAWETLREAQGALAEAEDDDPDPRAIPVTPDMLRASGRLEPVPSVGQDKLITDIQKRSDAAQALQALAPLLAIPAVGGLVNFRELTVWVLEQYGVPKMVRERMLSVPPEQLQSMLMQSALEAGARGGLVPQQPGSGNGTAPESGPSGPSGENLPTGGVVGAPGVAGGIGPPGMGG